MDLSFLQYQRVISIKMQHYPTIMILLVLASLLVSSMADCDACIEGQCQTKKTILEGVDTPSEMVIDRYNKILYLQTNASIDITILQENFKIRFVNTLGLAFDQDSRILYTRDFDRTTYYYKQMENATKEALITGKYLADSDLKLMLHKNALYYTLEQYNGLFVYNDEDEYVRESTLPELDSYTITDFVIDKNDVIYFVANSNVYRLSQHNENEETDTLVEIVTENNFLLSTDKYGDVYFGDGAKNVIYKMDDNNNNFVQYAVYKTGQIDKFTFDNNNNVVFYDSTDSSINVWNPDKVLCFVDAPHPKYNLNVFSKYELKKLMEIYQNKNL